LPALCCVTMSRARVTSSGRNEASGCTSVMGLTEEVALKTVAISQSDFEGNCLKVKRKQMEIYMWVSGDLEMLGSSGTAGWGTDKYDVHSKSLRHLSAYQ
jgi:hypothetical protein